MFISTAKELQLVPSHMVLHNKCLTIFSSEVKGVSVFFIKCINY